VAFLFVVDFLGHIVDMVLTTAWSSQVFIQSFTLVGIAELFDKTWFVALLMSLKYEKNLVFWSCFSALGAHTMIAVVIGAAINKIFPISVLHFGATSLYTFFAVLYLKDWYYADPDSDIIESGKAEAGEDLEQESGEKNHTELDEVVGCLEGGDDTEPDSKKKPESQAATNGPKKANNWKSIACQCFMAMFIAEWGDRTQIAMIGQHASQPLIPVCLGSLLAFFLLTVSAVMVGVCLDGAKLSEKMVHLVSSLSFFVFAALALMDGVRSVS
jgi:putative Ca2+/H+ antiporter (TMEM165/GDT1 family)